MTTRHRIEYLFDFVSPNAYLVWQVLPGLAARYDAELEVVPCLLGGLFKLTGNQPPFRAFAGVPAKMAYEHREIERFIAAHAITRFRMNPHFPLNSMLPMRVLVAAQAMGLGDAVVAAGLSAMWERDQKLDDPAVVHAMLADAGLDADALIAAAADDAVKANLTANTEAAAARGAFGIPTVFVDDEIYFGKERLPQIEAQLSMPLAGG